MNKYIENNGDENDSELGTTPNPSKLPPGLAPKRQTMSSVEEIPVGTAITFAGPVPLISQGADETRVKADKKLPSHCTRNLSQEGDCLRRTESKEQPVPIGEDTSCLDYRSNKGEVPEIDSNTLPGPAPSTPKAGKKAREARTKKRHDRQARKPSISPGGHCSRIRNRGELYIFSPMKISPASSSDVSLCSSASPSGTLSSSSPCSSSPTPISTAKKQSKVFTVAGKLTVEKEIRNLEKEQRKEFKVKDKDMKRAAELQLSIKKVKAEIRLENKEIEKLKNKIKSNKGIATLINKLAEKKSQHQKLREKLMELQIKFDDVALKEKIVTIKDKELSPLQNGRLPGQLDPLFKGYTRLFSTNEPAEELKPASTSSGNPSSAAARPVSAGSVTGSSGTPTENEENLQKAFKSRQYLERKETQTRKAFEYSSTSSSRKRKAGSSNADNLLTNDNNKKTCRRLFTCDESPKQEGSEHDSHGDDSVLKQHKRHFPSK